MLLEIMWICSSCVDVKIRRCEKYKHTDMLIGPQTQTHAEKHVIHTDTHTQTHTHTAAFTHRSFYTHTSFYTQKLLHTEAFTLKSFYTQKLSTHRSFYKQMLLHTEAATHGSFYTHNLLHTDAFAQRSFLHTEASTHRHFYTQKLHIKLPWGHLSMAGGLPKTIKYHFGVRHRFTEQIFKTPVCYLQPQDSMLPLF